MELFSDLDKKWTSPLGRLDSPETEKTINGGSGHVGLFEGFDYRRQKGVGLGLYGQDSFSYKSFTVCLFIDRDDPEERGKLRTKNRGKNGRKTWRVHEKEIPGHTEVALTRSRKDLRSFCRGGKGCRGFGDLLGRCTTSWNVSSFFTR